MDEHADTALEAYQDAVSDWIDPESLTPHNYGEWCEHTRRCRDRGLSPQECASRWGPKPMN